MWSPSFVRNANRPVFVFTSSSKFSFEAASSHSARTSSSWIGCFSSSTGSASEVEASAVEVSASAVSAADSSEPASALPASAVMLLLSDHATLWLAESTMLAQSAPTSIFLRICSIFTPPFTIFTPFPHPGEQAR